MDGKGRSSGTSLRLETFYQRRQLEHSVETSANVSDLKLVSDNLSSPFMLELTEKLLKKRVGEIYL